MRLLQSGTNDVNSGGVSLEDQPSSGRSLDLGDGDLQSALDADDRHQTLVN
ncbi:hypothetical protein KIN20_026989 [Parelaphostrongylus tenuis]|uniref:Uncharacterized protein n=1 Tax=Parelaphostrongylus tenuis TaxID=148309 RepID=A0AAD5WDB8_PARTN|nr:hypothetical protein KIN20_026989 [Parelaphostrongylus tenuis]